MKRTGRLIILLLGCLAVNSACRRTGQASTQPDTGLILLIGQSELHPQWPGISGAVQRIRRELPQMQCEALAARAESDAGLSAVVETALQRKPVVICLFVTDAQRAQRAAAAINAAGVRLVTLGDRVPEVPTIAHISIAWPEAAEMLGRQLPELAGSHRTYVLVHERSAGENSQECYQRFRAAADQRSEPVRLEEIDAGRATGTDPVGALLRKFPSAGRVVMVAPDLTATATARLGAPQTWLNPQHALIALGATPDRWEWLKDGRAVALAGPLDGDVGYAALEIAEASLRPQSVPRSHVTIPCRVVTAATLNEFVHDYQRAARGNRADLP